jgi:hypothetical protein
MNTMMTVMFNGILYMSSQGLWTRRASPLGQ